MSVLTLQVLPPSKLSTALFSVLRRGELFVFTTSVGKLCMKLDEQCFIRLQGERSRVVSSTLLDCTTVYRCCGCINWKTITETS